MAWSETITANWNDERFKDPVLIGSGPYAWVFRCNDNQTGGIVALKYYQLTLEGGLPHRILRDFAALHALNHPNVVRPIFARMELNCVKLVMEYVNSDLGKYLKDVPQLDPNDIKSFMFQILQGLSHCHSHGIVHRDLQPDNLLLDRDTKRIKIADFAHIRKSDDPPTANEITTQQYNPPEMLLRALDLTTAADIWSLGCTFAEMVKGRRLFPGPFDYVVLTNIIKILGVPNEQAWPGITDACHQLLGEVDPTALLPSRELDLAELFRELEPSALNLLTRMLRFLPNERISVADALQHPYFHDLQHNQ